MRIGALVRITDRGLGVQMRAFAQNIDCSVLVIRNPDDARLGLAEHPEWFPGAPTVSFLNGELQPVDLVRDFIRSVDVIFSAETMYDWPICGWARQVGVATVVQANPEFYKHGQHPYEHPTQWVVPTAWLGKKIPGATVLPVPSPEFVDRRAPRDGPLRAVHVVGHQAAGDRNGTLPLAYGLQFVTEPVRLTVTCQDQRRPLIHTTGKVQVRQVGQVENAQDLYAGQELLVLPRRYGGLCLPALEAMASGLAVAMTWASPQHRTWPIIPIQCDVFPDGHHAPGGMVPLANATSESVAEVLNHCAREPEFLAEHQAKAKEWALANTWDRWLPDYLNVMEAACEKET